MGRGRRRGAWGNTLKTSMPKVMKAKLQMIRVRCPTLLIQVSAGMQPG